MPAFSYMECYCPICRAEMDGMHGYGKENCCTLSCHEEWEWRRTLAILGKPYQSRAVLDRPQVLSNIDKALRSSEQQERYGHFPITMAELERRARQNGADPDRVDYSNCSDYQQTGAGWAEPPEIVEE
jgi:hypothetical protein